MSGLLALLGGQEHTPGCEPIDRRLLEEARRERPVVTVVLAATRPRRRSYKVAEALSYWRPFGVEVRFALAGGADEQVASLDALDDPDLIVLTGGHPWLLHARLEGTAVQRRIMELWQAGVAVAGSSAGAIALCEWRQFLQPPHPLRLARAAFGCVPGTAASPHYDRYGFRHWVAQVQRRHPALRVLGLTDQTALIGRDGEFRVHGRDLVTVVEQREATSYRPGQVVTLPMTTYALPDRPKAAPGRDHSVSPALLRVVQRGVSSLD